MLPIFTNPAELPPSMRGCVLAVGNFDGVHRGHARLVAQLTQLASELGRPAVVMTFDPPPMAILHPDRPNLPPITTIQRRAELLSRLGVDGLVAMPTSPKLLDLTPEQFFEQVLVGELELAGMVEGPNFRFGKDRLGDTKLLEDLCLHQNVSLRIATAATDPEGMFSSTRIRQFLSVGDIAAANAMLTQPFRLTGVVTSGAQRGRTIGFPTANLTEIHSIIPAPGVYAGRVLVDQHTYAAAINIGSNPTFDEHQSKVEVHIIDWSGSIYGQLLSCDLLARIREVQKFQSKMELLNQIEQDIQRCLEIGALDHQKSWP